MKNNYEDNDQPRNKFGGRTGAYSLREARSLQQSLQRFVPFCLRNEDLRPALPPQGEAPGKTSPQKTGVHAPPRKHPKRFFPGGLRRPYSATAMAIHPTRPVSNPGILPERRPRPENTPGRRPPGRRRNPLRTVRSRLATHLASVAIDLLAGGIPTGAGLALSVLAEVEGARSGASRLDSLADSFLEILLVGSTLAGGPPFSSVFRAGATPETGLDCARGSPSPSPRRDTP